MRATDEILRRGVAVVDRAAKWVGNAIDRQFDAERFIASNQTPYQVVYRDGIVTLRYYPPLAERTIPVGKESLPVASRARPVPLLLVPPLAANSMIFDLLPHRSLVRYLRARGLAVYLVDWGDPQDSHRHYGVRHYTTELLPGVIAALRKHAGTPALSLMGYCMGGLFALIHAGWARDADIRNIVTIASPIDYHQMGRAGELLRGLNGPVRLVRRFTPFRVHAINPRWMRVPGPVSSLVFKMTNPLGTLQSYIDLLVNLGDREFVTEHETTARWFNRMHDYPGGIVQDFFLRIGVDNQLARGAVYLGRGQTSELSAIDCPLLAIAGEQDQIVPLSAAQKILDVVASSDKQFAAAPGGHAGVFGGSRAPHNTWRIAADWLLPRSG